MLLAHCPLLALITWVYLLIGYPIILLICLLLRCSRKRALKRMSSRILCGATGILVLVIIMCELLFG